jgi:hypothetical protein
MRSIDHFSCFSKLHDIYNSEIFLIGTRSDFEHRPSPIVAQSAWLGKSPHLFLAAGDSVQAGKGGK